MITWKQQSFHVGSIKEQELEFIREISMDLFKIENDYVLHKNDINAHFSATEFLRNGINSNNAWDIFLKFWAVM